MFQVLKDELEEGKEYGEGKMCKFCDYVGKDQRELRSHKKSMHKDQLKLFNCPHDDCSYTSHWKDSMTFHNKCHDAPANWITQKCSYCDYIYTYAPEDAKGYRKAQMIVNSHMNEEHSEVKIKCQDCGKGFWTDEQLKAHEITHKHLTPEGDFQCDQCDYKCAQAPRLRVHMKSVHLGVKPHLCDMCPASFAIKSSLEKHKQHKHTDERNFPCMFCEKAFHSKQTLVTHIRTHTGEKPFTCEDCGKSFADQAYFTHHKRQHREGHDKDGKRLKTFICPFCSKGFTRELYLKYHITGAHENSVDGKEGDGKVKYTNEFKLAAVARLKEIGLSKTAEEMKVNPSTLKGWRNLSETPHCCTICEKIFPHKTVLKNHMLTHSDNGTEEVNKIPEKRTRYDPSFKQEVTEFALKNSILAACETFHLSKSTVNSWFALASDPKTCHLCGKNERNESTLRRHLERFCSVAKAEGQINSTFTTAEKIHPTLGVPSQPFSQYLVDQDLLPPPEEIVWAREEKERQEREKREFEETAKQMFEMEKQRWQDEQIKKAEERAINKQQSKTNIEPRTEIEKKEQDFKPILQRDCINEDSESGEANNNCGNDVQDDEYDDGNVIDQMKTMDNSEMNDFMKMLKTEDCNENDDSFLFEDSIKLEAPDEFDRIECNVNLKEENLSDENEIKTDFKVDPMFPDISNAGKEMVKCEFCGAECKEGLGLHEHNLRKHAHEYGQKLGRVIDMNQCDQCEKGFYVKRDLHRHKKRAHGPKVKEEKQFMCDICGEKFTRQNYVPIHKNNIHNIGDASGNVKRFDCHLCDKTYPVANNLVRHIKTAHGEGEYQCEMCSKVFATESGLKHHLFFHGDPQFECEVCHKKIRTKAVLKAHMKTHEEGYEQMKEIEPEQQCTICSKVLSSRGSLRNHMITVHDDSGAMHICNVCGREYKSILTFKAHLKTHDANYVEKKFTCETCGSVFKSERPLRDHIASIHFGQKNFPCDECGKLFNRKTNLEAHKKIHSGVKPFQCIYCNSSYGEKRNLMNHIGKTHPGCDLRFRDMRKETSDGSSILDA